MKPDSRLILALDITEKDRALAVAQQVGSIVDAVKVNWPIILGCGPGIITELAESAHVICDLKVADIPNTNRLIVEQAVARGAGGVICQGFVGSDSVKACVLAAGDADIFVVTEMSHPGGTEYTARHADELAKLAVDSGAAGVIAPATRPDRLAHVRSLVGDLLVLSPGVGAQGGKAGDAIKAGADFVILGRAIYDSDDPAAAARAIAGEIKDGLEG